MRKIDSLVLIPFSIVITFILIISIKCYPITNNKYSKEQSSFSLKDNNKKEMFVFMDNAECFI